MHHHRAPSDLRATASLGEHYHGLHTRLAEGLPVIKGHVRMIMGEEMRTYGVRPVRLTCWDGGIVLHAIPSRSNDRRWVEIGMEWRLLGVWNVVNPLCNATTILRRLRDNDGENFAFFEGSVAQVNLDNILRLLLAFSRHRGEGFR